MEDQFHILQRNFIDGHVFIDEYKDPRDYGEYYAQGDPISKAEESARLYYKYKTHRKTDYALGIFSFPVVSDRFKQILIEFEPDNLEFHPVQVICERTNEVDDSYSFVNILNNVECFDWENSEFETSPLAPKVILGVEKLAIRYGAVQDRHIVRIGELRSVILVSQKLRQRIEGAELTGIRFLKIEKYRK